MRRQLQVLASFMNHLDFIHMKPDPGAVASGVPNGSSVQVLAVPRKTYAIYLQGGTSATLAIKLPEGRYHAEWLDPRTGKRLKREDFTHRGAERLLTAPPYREDIALRIDRRR
jgi:hypothetical protein